MVSVKKKILAAVLCVTMATSAIVANAATSTATGSSASTTASTTAVTELKNTSTISRTDVGKGGSVILTPKAEGGTAPYTYAMECKHSSKDTWTSLRNYSTSDAQRSWTPTLSGTYAVRVKVKDATEKEVVKEFSLKVTANSIPGTDYIAYDFVTNENSSNPKAYYSYYGYKDENGANRTAVEFRGFVDEQEKMGTTVKIPSQVTSPRKDAESGSYLTYTVRNIKYIGHTDKVKKITKLYIPVTAEVIATDACINLGAETSSGTTIVYSSTKSVDGGNYDFTSKLYYIGDRAFKGAKISSFTLCDKITRIRYNSFDGASISTLTLSDDFNIIDNKDISPNIFKSVVESSGGNVTTVVLGDKAIVTDTLFKNAKSVSGKQTTVKANVMSYFYSQHNFSDNTFAFSVQKTVGKTNVDNGDINVEFVGKSKEDNRIEFKNAVINKDLVRTSGGFIKFTNNTFGKTTYIPLSLFSSSYITIIDTGEVVKDDGSTGKFTAKGNGLLGDIEYTFTVYNSYNSYAVNSTKNGDLTVELTGKDITVDDIKNSGGYIKVINKDTEKYRFVPIADCDITLVKTANAVGETGEFTVVSSKNTLYGDVTYTFTVDRGSSTEKNITVNVKADDKYIDITKYVAYNTIEQANGGTGVESVTDLLTNVENLEFQVLYKDIVLSKADYSIKFENINGGHEIEYTRNEETNKIEQQNIARDPVAVITIYDNDYCYASSSDIRKSFKARNRMQDSIIEAQYKDTDGKIKTTTLYDGTAHTEEEKIANKKVEVTLPASGNSLDTLRSLKVYTWSTKNRTALGETSKVDKTDMGNTRYMCSVKSDINEKGIGTVTIYIKGVKNGFWYYNTSSTNATTSDANQLAIEVTFK